MNKQLNNKQRKFLEYLQDEHDCLGATTTIADVLENGLYTMTERLVIKRRVTRFKDMLSKSPYAFPDIHNYGKPTKYLKG